MFSGLVSLFFGGEAKQVTSVDSTVDITDVQELTDSFVEEDYIPSTDNDEDKENSPELIDFETNEDEDWLLVNVAPVHGPLSEREMDFSRAEELHQSIAQITQEKQPQRKLSPEISPQDRNTVLVNSSPRERKDFKRVLCLLDEGAGSNRPKRWFKQQTSADPQKLVQDLLEHIKIVKPQQKARELNIRNYLAPSQIDRQNKVLLYEGKAKNNRRKDLWRCHSGANNNRKCC